MLNLITPEKTKLATTLVKEGKTVTLQISSIKRETTRMTTPKVIARALMRVVLRRHGERRRRHLVVPPDGEVPALLRHVRERNDQLIR